MKEPETDDNYDGLTQEEALAKFNDNWRIINEWAENERRKTRRITRLIFAVAVIVTMLALFGPLLFR